MENNKAFTLANGGKASFFDCHRHFLPLNHRYRKNRKDFFVGRVEKDVASPRLSGEELHDVVSEYGDIVFVLQSGKQKFPGFGLTHNWVKRSIFWELPYWKTNLLRHNLDVMHIEKNMLENIFNTVMDVKGKTKDNIKARLDIALYCNRKNMELVYDESRVAKPRASFVLEKNAQLLVYKWLKSLRFPDGHASNISRLVNIDDCRLYGMKSHDCHVFMQTLIPLAFRDLLPKGIWDAFMEISHFFRDICSSKLNVDHIERLQTNIVKTLCKLEMIFPPSFFDSMEHLPIHLPFEAKAGGPVQYRWMYPFERYLFNLKKKVKNKAHVEASICEAYIVEEISTFISYYFEPHLRTRINHVPRHDDGGEVPSSGNLSIFSNTGRPTPKNAVRGRYLSEIEFKQAHNYYLFNCDELRPFIQ
ncbi:uncharacterized protein LOC127904392 [Populus trichocarpa]|uniref:uncharacterized protein LOC127904392 n=1 Tax=Populus trichocarpa TaxID=3694 RepID=UPI00227983B1|nr:uncharacterized protein LOC127904392 [Populus trichocarpa]